MYSDNAGTTSKRVKNIIKAPANEETLSREHCRGNIVSWNVSSLARTRNICCGSKICFPRSKSVSECFQKHFASDWRAALSNLEHARTFIPGSKTGLFPKFYAARMQNMFLLPARLRTQESFRETMFPEQFFLVCGGHKSSRCSPASYSLLLALTTLHTYGVHSYWQMKFICEILVLSHLATSHKLHIFIACFIHVGTWTQVIALIAANARVQTSLLLVCMWRHGGYVGAQEQ